MPCNSPCRRRVSNNEMWRDTSGGEGAYLSLFADRSHLPLRGKLGWMTPRAGVKTTLAIETRLPGLPDPKRGPHFFVFRTLKSHLPSLFPRLTFPCGFRFLMLPKPSY